nr:Dyp-type peroxidase [Shewanella abyssi]
MVYPAPHAIFTTIALSADISRQRLATVVAKARQFIHNSPNVKNRHSSVILGVSLPRWKRICQSEGIEVPKGMTLSSPEGETPEESSVFKRSSGSFTDSNDDLWFHIKSDSETACQEILAFIKAELAGVIANSVDVTAASKSKYDDGKQGKVLGCRFSENLNNPADPVSIAKHTITGVEDIEHIGSSYVLAQRFVINWDQINSMTEDQIEDLIGRKTDDTIIPSRDQRSHIKSARMQDDQGNNTPILRLGLPFGKASTKSCTRVAKGTTVADEEGIYFAGFAKSVTILENIMNNQIGGTLGYMDDRLFNHIKSDLGGFFYIPSVQDLSLENNNDYANDFSKLEAGDWSAFPGVDWSRLDRHFEQRSENGLMYYNHKNYLNRMATMSAEDKLTYNPPSARVLSLLENTFSLWQDNWYINRKQDEIAHNLQHYMQQYHGEDKLESIMLESVMLRKGWATRLSLHLFTSKEYGFRGRKILLDDGSLLPYPGHDPEVGKVIYGSDTFRISPEEIIVGAMPNLSLGEGRYVMEYLTESERVDGFIKGLSEASGVGHVIPNFKKVLERGLGQLIADTKQMKTGSCDKAEEDFYQAAILSLQGISEYCLRYAELAQSKAENLSDGEEKERLNLKTISNRMKKLATDKPECFIDALQLIFTIHNCLHLTGEPTAFGRMDQLLQPFLDDDCISLDEAQEAIDAFYVKLDEKVQQNRVFMEDHQPFGNLAMGGSSASYPQGASLGQWIQQITVGGTVADGEPFETSKPAYNDVTKLFIRASARLPLNAPCLSLRTRKDMPEEILQEAADAILSGGAHPILLNDEKIIAGLKGSGKSVGGGDIADKSDGTWNSDVTDVSAQNYGCDGCYEPQFPGENWFALGGFVTLTPLECAINNGKTYASAGETFLYGKVESLAFSPVDKIDSFDALLALYFKHFEYLNRKAIHQQLETYGANSKFCPAPLLNNFMDGCIEKGQDFYSGGTKYNIFGPCYTGLSSTINSLYSIKQLVFDEKEAITTLPELLECLCCDWGYKMTEPFISSLAGEGRISARSDRFKRLREKALQLPRYGRGDEDIDAFGDLIVSKVADIAVETFTEPWLASQKIMAKLAKSFGSEEFPFGFQIQPGVGTFENTVAFGAGSGASADGRRSGASIASDLSAAPSPADRSVDHQYAGFGQSLAGFNGTGSQKMTEGAPTDFNIREDFPKEELVKVLKQFAEGNSSNVLTVTVANPEVFSDATAHPEKYDLLRVRTGGWTNFFTSVFPAVQEQHKRRPVSVPDGQCPFVN